MIKVLKIEPLKEPVTIEIESGLEALQKCVGGYIEAVYPYDDDVCIICNEEGKLIGLDLNRALRDENGKIIDVIAGTFLIVGLTEDDFGSLTDQQIETYSKEFASPEIFIGMNGRIEANTLC